MADNRMLLLSASDKFLERTRHCSLVGTLTANLDGLLDELGVKRKIGRHVSLLTHKLIHGRCCKPWGTRKAAGKPAPHRTVAH